MVTIAQMLKLGLKPCIRKQIGGSWMCSVRGRDFRTCAFIGRGDSPFTAYEDWARRCVA